MKFSPEKYIIPDVPMHPFIDPAEIWGYLNKSKASVTRVKILLKSLLGKTDLLLKRLLFLLMQMIQNQ
jgi:hypothetical protein